MRRHPIILLARCRLTRDDTRYCHSKSTAFVSEKPVDNEGFQKTVSAMEVASAANVCPARRPGFWRTTESYQLARCQDGAKTGQFRYMFFI